jgi:hypothetical protein
MPNQPCALMLPDGSCYDPDIAQDHTGVTFGARPKPLRRDPKRDPRNFMKSPAWLQCPHDGIAKQLGLPEAKPAFEMDIDMGAD